MCFKSRGFSPFFIYCFFFGYGKSLSSDRSAILYFCITAVLRLKNKYKTPHSNVAMFFVEATVISRSLESHYLFANNFRIGLDLMTSMSLRHHFTDVCWRKVCPDRLVAPATPVWVYLYVVLLQMWPSPAVRISFLVHPLRICQIIISELKQSALPCHIQFQFYYY